MYYQKDMGAALKRCCEKVTNRIRYMTVPSLVGNGMLGKPVPPTSYRKRAPVRPQAHRCPSIPVLGYSDQTSTVPETSGPAAV